MELTRRVPPKQGGKRKKRQEDEESQAKRNAERATVLAQDGQYTKALQALTSVGMAPPDRANLATMKEKHPRATSAPPPAPTTDLPQLSFSQVEVEKAMRRFRRGSAPGPSGLRPEHLKVSLQSAPGRRERALASLTRLVNVMAAGGVPAEVAPFLAGARLHAALKKDGGIRPIAVGNLLRRLVGRCCSTRLQEKASAYFSPHQLGVGVRKGCETILHSTRKVLEVDPSLWCLQIDFINAFNLVNREAAFKEVLESFPEILAWVSTCYSQDSHLLFGSTTLLSQCGFHQGDPLAALLFSLVLQAIINLIQERVPSLKVNAWFLDDGTLVGTIEELKAVVDLVREEGPQRGLILSTAATSAPAPPKSTIWSPGHVGGAEDPLNRGLERVKEEGVILLGAPMGSPAFVAEKVKLKVAKVEEITSLLPLLEDPHTEFSLLRSCLSLPKISFLLRTVDTSVHTDLLQSFDRVTREGLTRILGSPLDERAWCQAKLPVALGGLGLRGAEDHAPAAYAASYLSSQLLMQSLLGEIPQPLQDDQEDESNLSRHLLAALSAAQGEEALEADLVGMTQHQMSAKIDLHLQRQLIGGVDDEEVREVARLNSLSLPHAGDWLNTPPLTALGLHLRPIEFVLAVKYRLGLPVYDRAGPCPACLRPSDVQGDHAMCCGSGGERISRHNALRDAFFDTASSAGLAPVKEGRFLLPGDDRRPADVLVPHWAAGRDAAMDVTVVHPIQDATMPNAATTPGFALSFAHDRKIRGAEEDCRRQGIAFIPLVAESFGGWHTAAEREVRKLGAALARHTGQDEGEAIGHLWGRLGILLQRGNAALLANRVPELPGPLIDGVL